VVFTERIYQRHFGECWHWHTVNSTTVFSSSLIANNDYAAAAREKLPVTNSGPEDLG
jgi:hypothetical protein